MKIVNEYNSKTSFLGHHYGGKIIEVLKEKLLTCDSFKFSVSFIRESGLRLLYSDIKNALERGAKGSIVTTDYMRITEVTVLKQLLELMNAYKNNFSVYFLETKSSDYSSFHTKGYIFTEKDTASIIIGSSNMSEVALSSNGGEWSLYSMTVKEEELFNNVDSEFDKNISDIPSVLCQQQIDNYSNGSLCIDFGTVTPNYMQIEALKALNDLRVLKEKKKALIVAAMGSGKTYLSAFDAKNTNSKRILYVCHIENVLRKAKNEYEDVFKGTKTYGFLVNKEKDINADIVFTTNISLCNNLEKFKKDDFDYIVIDEAHHEAAETYQKITSFFNPLFLLGMTGTPDRMDQKDIRKSFGENIPYELTLRDAIENKLIMPFKYYSVYDDKLNYSRKNDKNLISEMVTYEHGAFIDKNIREHKHEVNGKIKCIAFCASIDHAKGLCELMKKFKYTTALVTGDTEPNERKKIFDRLQNEKRSSPDCIFYECNE